MHHLLYWIDSVLWQNREGFFYSHYGSVYEWNVTRKSLCHMDTCIFHVHLCMYVWLYLSKGTLASLAKTKEGFCNFFHSLTSVFTKKVKLVTVEPRERERERGLVCSGISLSLFLALFASAWMQLIGSSLVPVTHKVYQLCVSVYSCWHGQRLEFYLKRTEKGQILLLPGTAKVTLEEGHWNEIKMCPFLPRKSMLLLIPFNLNLSMHFEAHVTFSVLYFSM